MFCQNGCGEESTYITKKLKHVCNKNAGKCKAINPKGKKKTNRRQASLYVGNLLCEFCNIHQATHILVNGKRCCSSTAGNCKEIRKIAGKKVSVSRNQINPNFGLKNSDLIAQKVAVIKANDIDETGLNAHQRNGKKVASIKANDIDDTGLNAHQRNGQKYVEWLNTDAGKQHLLDHSERQKQRQNSIDNKTGLKESKRRAIKAVETMLTKINELGLNGFDQRHWKTGKNTGFVNGVFWQYSNERRFLERAIIDGSICKVKRGPAIEYEYNGEHKRYMADYIIDNNLYEVKSKYTMFGKNNEYLRKNVAKLLAAKKFGYDVYVVIDDKTISLAVFLDSISNLLE